MIVEKERQIPVAGNYDVIVSGGGIAGIAAALAAARTGAKTLLIEKMYLLGGLATSGLITVYLPICDGNGTQVSFGLAEELLRLSVKHGIEPTDSEVAHNPWLEDGTPEERKKERFRVRFNGNLYAVLCEKLLEETGVDILMGSSICSAAVEDGKITAVITENKSGRQAYTGKSFVDATGDADLCWQAGEDTVNFQQGNVWCTWFYEAGEDGYKLHVLGTCDKPDKYKTPEELANDTRTRYTGLDGKEISDMVCLTHSQMLESFLTRGGIGPNHALATVPTIPELRMTRRIDGLYAIHDTEKFKHFEDSIGMVSDWRRMGPVYELPFRCLYGRKIKNLIACGRCMSATDDMWDITRVIPDCVVTGEAAGTAAAMSDDFGAMDVKILQKKLQENGVRLHLEDVGLTTME